MTTRPLPNNVLHPGDLCPSSFGSALDSMVEPLDDDPTSDAIIEAGHGWVRCRACGEAVNLKGGRIPSHTIPGEPSADDLLEDVRSAQGQLRSLAKRLRDDRDRAVRAARDAGISQSRIAEVAGISQPAVAKILHKEPTP